jgi:hypothetical protein
MQGVEDYAHFVQPDTTSQPKQQPLAWNARKANQLRRMVHPAWHALRASSNS